MTGPYSSSKPMALALGIEFTVLFLLLPLAYRFSPFPMSPLPVLWAAALYCYFQYRRHNSIAQIWNSSRLTTVLPSLLLPFFGFAVVTGVVIWKLDPGSLFALVRHHTWLWALIMVLYPILSVFPQALVYRAFLMTRYRTIFSSPVSLILASAFAFSFMHIVFRNPVAVGLTLLGGLLFAWRFYATRSLAVSTLEHALYGCSLFTLGLGEYFYHGRVLLH